MQDDLETGWEPQNIRDILGGAIGKQIVEITQMDPEEWHDGEDPYIMLMLADGSTMKMIWPCHGEVEYFDADSGETYGIHLMSEEELDEIEDEEDDYN